MKKNIMKVWKFFYLSLIVMILGCSKKDVNVEYEAKIMFWCSKASSDYLLSKGHYTMLLYVDGNQIGTYSTYTYLHQMTECDNAPLPKYKINLGKSKTKEIVYQVFYAKDMKLYSHHKIIIKADECRPIEF